MTFTVDPEMQAILQELLSNPAPDPRSMPIAEARAASERAHAVWNEPRLEIGAVEDIKLAGEHGPLRTRLYAPAGEASVPVVVFAHGGGWTFGSFETHDVICRQLAHRSGCAVLATDYRLAPEHPFPAPNQDVIDAIRCVQRGGLGERVDAGRVGVAGDSAGANLMLSALLSMRADGGPVVSAAALLYGCYTPDLETASQARLGDGPFMLTTDAQRWFWSNFLGSGLDEPDPLAAPLHADLTGLPPIYLLAAGLDPLLDDTLALCRRLAEAGVPYRFDFFPGVVHGFLRMTKRLGAARLAMQRIAGFFEETLARP